jgi:phospholipid/cholesterol/gamma-HCH transport system substrate-binding protein
MTGGAFILAVLVAIPLGFKVSDRYNTYFASFEGESMSGLEQGAIVKFHGIPVGRVEKLSYDAKNINRVRVTLKIQQKFPVKKDMVAQTGMMGITGLMYLEIMGGSNDAPILKSGAEIPTKRSMISTITGKAEAIVAKIELLLNHINELSNPDSLRSIKTMLDNVAVITTDARAFMDNVRPNLENVAGATQRVITTIDSISQDIQVLTGDLRKGVSGGQIATILASVDSTTRSLKELSGNLSLTVKQGKEDITVSLENIRQASENANELTKILSENPSLLLKGEQQRERDTR